MTDFAKGISWKDHAILYRMNAQSSQLEYAFKRNGIPYRIIGGTRFFDRAEVKDMVAYLCTINNPADDLRLRRIINTPTRGIGAKTIDTAQEIAVREGRSLYDVISHVREYPELAKAAAKLAAFVSMIDGLREKSTTMDLDLFYQEVLDTTGYITALQAKNSVENRSRIENVRELATSIQGYLENAGEAPSLAGFLDEIALYTDLDNHDPSEDCVVMMTMHSAKGLEFPYVYVVGMEEGIFPGIRAIGDMDEMEEERRLCYVAMTRAKERLILTCASQRMLFGRTSNNRPSRFVSEIPDDLLTKSGYAFRVEQRQTVSLGSDGDVDQTPKYQGGYDRTGYGTSGTRQKPARTPGIRSTSSIRTGAGRQTTSPGALGLRRGDMVMHKAFGQGMVISMTPMANDTMLEIAFDKEGTKKLMLNYAGKLLTKIE
jgi:DNA helicase-2/ATP-dependent DNA helicase PcrA